jgi:anaerobic selenocysteine-containing dehydrogenase
LKNSIQKEKTKYGNRYFQVKRACNQIKFYPREDKEENQTNLGNQEEEAKSQVLKLQRTLENDIMFKKGKWKEAGWKYQIKKEAQKMVSKGDTEEEKYKKKEFQYLISLEIKKKEKGYYLSFRTARKKEISWRRNKEKEFNYLISIVTKRKKDIQMKWRLINYYFQALKKFTFVVDSNQLRSPLNLNSKSSTKHISKMSPQLQYHYHITTA